MSSDNTPQKSTVIDAKKAIFDKIFKENQELREQNYELSHTLKNFEELAQEREDQHKRFADLEESILKADDLYSMISEIKKKLAADFAIPMANLSLIENVKNSFDFEEIFAPEIYSQTENTNTVLTFINEADYNRLFPQHYPLVTEHPDPKLLTLLTPLTQPTEIIASSAFVPLISRGRAIGTLNMASSDPEKFIPGTATDAVESLGRKIATVIENSILTAQLQKLLRTDPLTTLYNRRTLDELLPVEFARAQRYAHPISLIMIDLDDFKFVNDRYGHPAGDQVLTEIGLLIKSNLRQYDIGIRYGGDEFTIILPNTNYQQGQAVIEKITKLAAAAEVKIGNEIIIKIKLSTGLATYPNTIQATDYENLIKAADKELYKNKEAKKAH